jgi:hypothetical protein
MSSKKKFILMVAICIVLLILEALAIKFNLVWLMLVLAIVGFGGFHYVLYGMKN